MDNETMKQMKAHFQSELKEKFNEAKFDEDVRSGKHISLDNLNEYRKKEKEKILPPKKDDKNRMSNGRGLYFIGHFKNGVYEAIGSNGHIIKSKNIDDFHRQLAKIFKLNSLREGSDPICSLRIGESEPNKEKLSESFARNFINEGIAVAGDLPKSPEFWNKMKTKYLAQKGHDLKTWNRLVRFVPKEYMQPNHQVSAQKSTPISSMKMAQSRGGR